MILLTLSSIGARTLSFFRYVGDFSVFTFESVLSCFRPPYYWRQLGLEMYKIGYLSLPVVGLTAIFTGMVLALQSYTGFSRFSAESAIATVVVLSITRELGPVMGGLMVAGRVGASMAAEIGTMRVTEQIDALEIMGVNSASYLILPKIIAALLIVPVIIIYSMFLGVMGGWFVSAYSDFTTLDKYLMGIRWNFTMFSIVYALIKTLFFAFIITSVPAFFGYYTRGGSIEIGRSSTKSVVYSSICILIVNYILTQLLLI